MNTVVERKGYSKRADIPKGLMDRLSYGKEESKTLAEITAIDMSLLMSKHFPLLTKKDLVYFDSGVGILKKMKHAAQLVSDQYGYAYHKELLKRVNSDTLRGIGSFMVGANDTLSPKQKVKAVTTYAKDAHFGVREWAWMAIRDDIASDFESYYDVILGLSKNKHEYIKRFSVESIRPRGVWATHIAELKEDPSVAEEVIENLFFENSKYINDSVGNWLNDAAKDHPAWVSKKCKALVKLADDSKNKSLIYTVGRATRSIK